LSALELHKLDKNYTKLLAEVILSFMKTPENITLISSHGHTILHQPEQRLTYQIGNLPELSTLLKKTVVCDFRTADVKLGGQGAPLVPIGDKLLFPQFDYCINIGGFVNISFEQGNQRKAYDICPANKILNYYAEKLGVTYDNEGKFAKSGNCNQPLFNALNNLNYYSKSPPKSLGIEWIEEEMLPVINRFEISEKDILNTLCHHISFQIAKAISTESSKILLTGGGAYHDYLVDCIRTRLKSSELIIPDQELVEYKEALIFGLLGILRFRNDINVLNSVTGSAYSHSSGVIYQIDNS
jgi:anhydro-N-acetylmuramic acid kinase